MFHVKHRPVRGHGSRLAPSSATEQQNPIGREALDNRLRHCKQHGIGRLDHVPSIIARTLPCRTESARGGCCRALRVARCVAR